MSIVQLSRFFVCVVLFKRQLLYFIKSFCLCQELFYFSLSLFSSFPLPSHATGYLGYHFQNSLSTTFLIFSNLFSNRKTFVSAVDFHTTILFPALSTTFYIYFSKHLQWHKRRKKRNLNLLRFFSYFLLVVNGERGI